LKGLKRVTSWLLLKHLLYILLAAFATHSISAQDIGSVRGTVKSNSSPVEFANVFVSFPEDSTKIYKGTITDSLGRFMLGSLPVRKYFLYVSAVGFQRKKVEITLPSEKDILDLGDISVVADTQLLNAVEVKSMRDIVERTEGGLILNAKDNLTQAGGTAADLLRNMPGILVDSDGGITIRGKNPLVMINGRISGIAGVDRSAQLDRIPASTIERIEIVNNPTARYDADAEGGIINIILKKNMDLGTNGAFAVGMGRGDRNRVNGSALINHKTTKWNFGGAYDNWYTTRTRRVTGDRNNFDIPDQFYLMQRRHDERLIFYQNAKATIDFTPNDKNAFNFEVLWAFPGENNHETLKNTNETSDDRFVNRNQRYSNEIRRTHNVEPALTYRKRFKDSGKSLTATISDAIGNDRENTDITTTKLSEEDEDLGNSSVQRTRTYQKTNLLNASLDLSHPIGKALLLESGYKGIQRMLNADYGRSDLQGNEYVVDPRNTNVFDFREQIHAIYSQISGWTGDKQSPRFKYIIGLRAEKVWNHGHNLDKSTDFENKYFFLYPSASVNFNTKGGDNIKFTYGRRINRPGLGQLNPFTDITDSLNQYSGNPHLKPELVNSLELGYNIALAKGSINMTSFYRNRTNAIYTYTVLNDDGVAFTTPLNFGTASSFGVEVIASRNLYSFWNVNLSVSAFETRIDNSAASAEVALTQKSWYTKLINNISTGKKARLQAVFSYVSPTAISQGRSIAIYNVDLGYQHQVLNGRGKLGVVITDIFNTQKSGLVTSANNFTFARSTKLDTRAIMITFGYTFRSAFNEKLMENRFRND